MKEVLYQTTNYTVQPFDSALQEDGTTFGPGYAVINKTTGRVEFTHMQLPHIIWTCDHMSKALDDLLGGERAVEGLETKRTIN